MITSIPSHPSPSPELPKTCRTVVFSIAGHSLALPLAAVLKVIPRSAVLHNQVADASLVYLDQQPITLLNLHPLLSYIPASHRTSVSKKSGQFLLIVGLDEESQWAIPVDESPTLLELPLSSVRLLPAAYRQAIQNIACHVAVLNHALTSFTLLLLNLKQAASLSQDW